MTEEGPLLEIHRALGRIEGKQDALLTNQESLKKDHSNLREDHAKLVGKVHGLDARLHWYSGGLAVVVFLLTFLKDRLLGGLFN